MQMAYCYVRAVQAHTSVCVFACARVRVCEREITPERERECVSVSQCVCVCVYRVYLWVRQVWPPRRWQSDQTLCVTYKLLWPFFLSDSWLDGNKGHFTQLERVLKSAKHEEMASEEINSGKCLSSAGSKHTTLFPCVYALPISQKTSKKNLSIYCNTLCSESNWIYCMITENVIVETKCCSVSEILAITSRQVSRVLIQVQQSCTLT